MFYKKCADRKETQKIATANSHISHSCFLHLRNPGIVLGDRDTGYEIQRQREKTHRGGERTRKDRNSARDGHVRFTAP